MLKPRSEYGADAKLWKETWNPVSSVPVQELIKRKELLVSIKHLIMIIYYKNTDYYSNKYKTIYYNSNIHVYF